VSREPRGVGPEERSIEVLQEQARAALRRCRSEDGSVEDVDELEEILRRLPDDRCLYERGYVAYQSGQDAEAVEYLYRAGVETFAASQSPPPCEELYPWILPLIIEPLPQLWCRLAAEFRKAWPDSAAFCLLRGYAELYNDPETAVQYFADCLQADPACWPAAAEMGNLYFDAQKWKWAFDCYEHALPSAPAGEQAILHFNAALCMSRLEEWRKAAEHYAACLKHDPEFEYAPGPTWGGVSRGAASTCRPWRCSMRRSSGAREATRSAAASPHRCAGSGGSKKRPKSSAEAREGSRLSPDYSGTVCSDRIHAVLAMWTR